MTAAGMVAEARKSLGMASRPNTITREYAARNGDEFLRAAWCDQAITYWARRSGNADAVLPGGDRAYTVWHATDFKEAGRWHSGTATSVDQAKPGDIVFFDWGATNSIGAIDHVGIVEKVLGGGRVQTIEGNTGDACLRRVRDASVIAGFGRPAYSGGTSATTSEEDDMLGLKKGDTGDRVELFQEMLKGCGPKFAKMIDDAGGSDGQYGGGTAETFRQVRLSVHSKAAEKKGAGDKVTPTGLAQMYAAHGKYWGKK